MKPRGVIVLVAVLLSFAGVLQARAATYVVLSLIDYQLTVVHAVWSGGGPAIEVQTFPRSDHAFDVAVLRASDAAIHRLEPDAKVVSLATNDAKLYAWQKRAMDGQPVHAQEIIDLLQDQLATEPGARVIIVVARQAAIAPRGLTAGGKPVVITPAPGLGFYVASNIRMKDQDNRDSSWGFIVPFVNFRMVLVDSHPSSVVSADVNASASKTVMDEGTGRWDTHWNKMPPDTKVRLLESLLDSEVNRVVPVLLRQRQR